MFRSMCKFSLVCAILCVVNRSVFADDCINATAMANLNVTELSGTWYEVARKPAPAYTFECVQANFNLLNSTTLNINLTYANNVNQLWKNISVATNVTFSDSSPNSNGYLTYFTMGGNNSPTLPPAYMKILNTDYTNYALVCGYTPAANGQASTTFGIVLARSVNVNVTQYSSMAPNNTDFTGNLTMINQSQQCHVPKNGASANLPTYVTTAVFAVLLAVMKYFN